MVKQATSDALDSRNAYFVNKPKRVLQRETIDASPTRYEGDSLFEHSVGRSFLVREVEDSEVQGSQPTRLPKNYAGARELRWSARVAQ